METEKGEKKGVVDYREAPSISVGNLLISKGYIPASCGGIALQALVRRDSLGILRGDPEAKETSYLFGLFRRRPRRKFLGVIWFDKDDRGANEQNWVVEIHGRDHVETARQIAEEMATTFNVNIAICLITEQCLFEQSLSDFNQY